VDPIGLHLPLYQFKKNTAVRTSDLDQMEIEIILFYRITDVPYLYIGFVNNFEAFIIILKVYLG
jgi:hypothetical protein